MGMDGILRRPCPGRVILGRGLSGTSPLRMDTLHKVNFLQRFKPGHTEDLRYLRTLTCKEFQLAPGFHMGRNCCGQSLIEIEHAWRERQSLHFSELLICHLDRAALLHQVIESLQFRLLRRALRDLSSLSVRGPIISTR